MKLYALFTLHETGWGTRAGIGDRTSHFDVVRAECRKLMEGIAATATAANEKKGGDGGSGQMGGEARGEVYDLEMNGVKRKG